VRFKVIVFSSSNV